MNWLLLRGLTREQSHWGNFIEVFSKTIPDAKIHCLDLPGVGTENSRPSPSNISAIADDIRARWLPLHDSTGGDWSLLSISLGSMVGLDWLQRYSHDFKKAVVINTSAGGLNSPWERLDYRMLPSVLATARKRDPFEKERLILQMTTHMQRDLDGRARDWAEVSRLRPVKVATAVAQLRAALNFRLRTPIKTPVLVLNSVNDRFTVPSCSERLAKALDSKLVTHSFAGHDITLDDPEWVSQNVKDFIDAG